MGDQSKKKSSSDHHKPVRDCPYEVN